MDKVTNSPPKNCIVCGKPHENGTPHDFSDADPIFTGKLNLHNGIPQREILHLPLPIEKLIPLAKAVQTHTNKEKIREFLGLKSTCRKH